MTSRSNGAVSTKTPDDRIGLDGRVLTKRTSLSIPPGMSINAWRHLGRQIFVISDSSAWWLGDWLIYGQRQYPDRYKRAIQETSLDYQTLRNYAWVARQFPVTRRRSKLSFQHHAEVASLSEPEQDAWLDRAEQGSWSRNELRRQIRASKSPGRLPGEVTHIQMNVIADQKRRWQEAAESAEQDLLAWIVAILDRAATTALESGKQIA
ncbi:LmbU family transcriptional regulator [Nonomuraea polychroma]|uniref:LmbU family transcriptional regulator n=1 Tax=Nonomuraea polychroma TaxID=46176 RepID=UPI003D8A99F9